MLAYLAIGGAVVPRLRGLEGGKLQDDHALNLRSFDHLVTTIGGRDRDRVAAQGVANLLRVGFKLRRVGILVAEVPQYVARDVRATPGLATVCEARGAFRRVARSGRLRTTALPEGWLAVEAAGRLPEPDTSWMDEPWSRTRFMGWLG